MPGKEEYERRKADGVCCHCGGNPAEEGNTKCKVCREYMREYMREYDHKRWQIPGRREYKREHDREYRHEIRQTITGKFKNDMRGAKRRGYYWEFSIDQAGFYYTQPCHYCGEEPNGKLNGIDRQDNSVGYIIENCVPCCPTCNYAKQQLSPEEFIWHCNKVVKFNKKSTPKDERYNQQTILIRR